MKWKSKCMLCLLPCLIGTILFYIIPFFKVVYYSLLDNQFTKKFCGINNYIEIVNNKYFILALKNSILIILVCVPVVIITAIYISILINKKNRLIRILSPIFILPMVIPTAAVTPIWRNFFSETSEVFPILLLFVWKNIGICIILISAAINTIPINLYEAALLDGADKKKSHQYITLPCSAPSIIFSVLISIVNSFRIYKESYLFYGTNYPPEHSYTLQFYMNNNFLKLDYQALSAGAIINTIIILFVVLIMMQIQRKYSW